MFDRFKKKKSGEEPTVNENIITEETKAPEAAEENTEEISGFMQPKEFIVPLVPLRGLTMGPEMRTAIDLGRRQSVMAAQEAHKEKRLLAFSAQFDQAVEEPAASDLMEICCVADLNDISPMHYDTLRVNVTGLCRARIIEYIQTEPFFIAKVQVMIPTVYEECEEIVALKKVVINKFKELTTLLQKADPGVNSAIEGFAADNLVDYVTANTKISYEDYYDIFLEEDTAERLSKTAEALSLLIKSAEIDIEIENRIVMRYSADQRTRYLREKKRVIDTELGEVDTFDDDISEYIQAIKELPLEEDYREKLLKEVSKLEMMPPTSQDAAVISTYIDLILDLPWDKKTEDTFALDESRKILDEDHYGLEKVKDRILEYLAVVKLTNSLKAPILCLVGSPGVGKTSVGKSIARATGRKFVRISLGGVHDESEIRGHRKTYVGAMPGRIISGLRQVKVNNPVFLLDEIDKLARDLRGDPSSALLEVLDPEQNSTFTDTYAEIPFDLSNVMFIATANNLSSIPEPLLDRMEIIELPGYIATDKKHIARNHLIPKQLKMNGITAENLIISDEVLDCLINNYTRESGVRQLERTIASLCRKAAKMVADDENAVLSPTVSELDDLLGRSVATYDIAKDEELVGVVNGLAWTQSGGDTLQIEMATAPGSGKLELTGNLGDVMKESVHVALGHIKTNAGKYGLENIEWDKTNIHIHVPEGAVPKDGPSAGITMTTALISALSKRPVSQKIAMTGEISLTGRVLPIGGLREKLLAASRATVNKVLIPKENEKDLRDVPKEILDTLTIIPVERMTDVYEEVFNK
ncbi:MAG: endopeptidase La [Eubacteriaceae bacterium]|nr:endopeptidase La [Eubacteriaceae bacterium]